MLVFAVFPLQVINDFFVYSADYITKAVTAFGAVAAISVAELRFAFFWMSAVLKHLACSKFSNAVL